VADDIERMWPLNGDEPAESSQLRTRKIEGRRWIRRTE